MSARILILLLGCMIATNAKYVAKRQAGTKTKVTVGLTVDSHVMVSGSDGAFKGFIPDVLKGIAERLDDIEFEMVEVPDVDQQILQLDDQTIGVAGGPLRQNEKFASLFARSAQYLNNGFSLVVARPQPVPLFANRFFLHFRPFTVASWVFCGLCTLGVAALLYLLNRFHPKEKCARPQSGAAVDAVNEGRRVADACWFVCRSFNLQGIERRPKSIAARVIAVGWIMFVLDSLFIYLSALVSNAPLYYGPLTSSTPRLPFDDATSYANLAAAAAGSSSSSSPYRTVALEKYRALIESSIDVNLIAIASRPIQYVSSSDSALKLLQSGRDYAYLAPTYDADYYVTGDCNNLAMLSGLVEADSFSFGFRSTDNFLLSLVNSTIQDMLEDGQIQKLFLKWSNQNRDCNKFVPASSDRVPAIPTEVVVSMSEYGGVVLSLIILVIVALIIAILEVLFMQRSTKSYDVEKAGSSDPEKQPILDEEEGQAVRYEDNEEEPIKAQEEEELEAPCEEEKSVQEEVKEQPKEEEEAKEDLKEEIKEEPKEEAKEEKKDEEKDTDEKEAEESKPEEDVKKEEPDVKEEPAKEEKNEEAPPEESTPKQADETPGEKETPKENETAATEAAKQPEEKEAQKDREEEKEAVEQPEQEATADTEQPAAAAQSQPEEKKE